MIEDLLRMQWFPPDWQRFTGGDPAIPKAELDAAE